MSLLNRLPNSRRSAPGLERAILRQLPAGLVAGTLLPLLAYGVAWLFPQLGGEVIAEKFLKNVGIAAIAAAITAWTAVFTIAIGCTIVMLMKGHAYVADRYDLIDSDSPDSEPKPGRSNRR